MTIHTPLGPRPTPTERPSEAAMRVLDCLAGAGEPMTINELAAELGGHPNTVRLHLEGLVAAGLVLERTAAASGRGRPARQYTASADGRQVTGLDPGALAQNSLMAAIIEQLTEAADPPSAAVEFGRRWGRRLDARTSRDDGSAGLLATLTRQGFAPEKTAAGLELRTCPLLAEAREHPDVVCGIHHGMIEEVAGTRLRLLPFALPGACLVLPVDPGRDAAATDPPPAARRPRRG